MTIADVPQGLWLPPRTATLVVAASNSSNRGKAQADYVCDGTDDHVEIQAAIDALPATGGEVFLLDGTYNIEVALVLDSYQTLRGCGRNTILTTTTADLDIITATGSSGSEKVGILVANLCIDGFAGGVANGDGIGFRYVDYSKIINIWLRRIEGGTIWAGIGFEYCDFNEVLANTIEDTAIAILLSDSTFNIISGNICLRALDDGILIGTGCANNTIIGNIVQGSVANGITVRGVYNTVSGNIFLENEGYGIFLSTQDFGIISGNICHRNGKAGIFLALANHNVISGNTCIENSQVADNTHDNIRIGDNSDYNLITNNLCRTPTIGTTLTDGEPMGETEIAVTNTAGFEVGMGVVLDLGGVNVEYHRISAISAGAPGVITIDAGLTNDQAAGETINVPEARYGINISDGASENNIVKNNDLYDSGKTAPFNDAGTLTEVRDNRGTEIYDNKVYQRMKNTSGGALVAGDVVVFKTGIAAGNEITTTVNKGDDYVYGMVAEAIANNAVGLVQIGGKTTALKVDGTDDIAIGDFICTFTTAKIGCKAGAGDMAFAIALEAYATDDSNGVIDALIISGMKI